MNWMDIAMIVFSVTLANHMGLIEAMEKVIRHKIPILNCCKCGSFWLVLTYALLSRVNIIHCVAISFLCSYVAVWFELLLGSLDKLYNYAYENLFTTETTDTEDSETEVS